MLPFQMENEAQAILLNLFTIAHHANGSLSFVRNNESYPCANGINNLPYYGYKIQVVSGFS